MTGTSWFNAEVAAKGWGCCTSSFPAPNRCDAGQPERSGCRDAASGRAETRRACWPAGRHVNAATTDEIDAAFAALVQQRAAALVVASNPFYLNRRDQIIALAARHAVPAIYSNRD